MPVPVRLSRLCQKYHSGYLQQQQYRLCCRAKPSHRPQFERLGVGFESGRGARARLLRIINGMRPGISNLRHEAVRKIRRADELVPPVRQRAGSPSSP